MRADIECVCVYYPHWHRYPKGDEWFGADRWRQGEWEFVKTARPRFPGHRQPIVPLPGYLDGASPPDVEREIDLAADAGIGVFLYDYYYYGGRITQEEALEHGFLRARNRDRMKFAIMWCYHERRDQFRPDIDSERRVLMTLDRTPEEFHGLIRLCCERYFPHPQYWRRDGALFFSLFNAPYFCGHRERDARRIRDELDEARRIVREAGLGEIHFNAQGAAPEEAAFMADCGFDSLTDYNTTTEHLPPRETAALRAKGIWEIDYRNSFPTVRRRWREMSAGPLPYIPNVTTGWDTTPRCRLDEPYPWRMNEYPYLMSYVDNTPEAFREILAEARAFAENDPKRPGAVYVNGWNEYTEGAFLLPDAADGDRRLQAVASVFGGKPRHSAVSFSTRVRQTIAGAVCGLALLAPCIVNALSWSLPPCARIEGETLIVDVRPDTPKTNDESSAHCEAGLDLAGSDAPDFGVALSVRVRARNVTKPDMSWNGVKVMLRYVGAETGKVYWLGASLPVGTFDWTNATVRVNALNATERPQDGKAFIILGLQGCFGHAEFDLSSLLIETEDPGIPIVNQDWVVRYPGQDVFSHKERKEHKDFADSASFAAKKPLRGCMLPSDNVTEDHIETLHQWGATLARFQIQRNWLATDDNQDLDEYAAWVDSRLDNLEEVLRWAGARGMKICIDLHSVPGGKRAGDRAMNMFFEAKWADAFVETWRRIAARFNGNQAIYGYDLVNEPDQRVPAPVNYWEIQRRAAEAVRAIDPATPIIVESNIADSAAAFRYLSPLAMDNVIYQVHCYEPMAFTHQGVIPSRRRSQGPGDLCWPGDHDGETWDREFLRRSLEPVRAFQLRHLARIYVGEFSAASYAQGAENYIRDCISLFEEYGWDWTYHAFREANAWNVEKELDTSAGSYIPSADNPRKRALLEGLSP